MRVPTAAFTSAAASSPRPEPSPDTLMPSMPSIASSCSASVAARSMPDRTGSAEPSTASMWSLRQVEARERPEDRRRALVGEHGHRGDQRHRHARRTGGVDERGDGVDAPGVVEDAGTRAGVLLDEEAARPQRPRRGHRRLGHRHRQAGCGGHRRQPGAVEVEDLGDLRSDARRPTVAGDAEDGVDVDVGEAGDLLLQHDAVAIPAAERDHRVTAGLGSPARPSGSAGSRDGTGARR